MPFDFDNIFGFNGTEGTRRLRLLTAVIGALIGALIGYFVFGVVQDTPAPPVVNGLFGAVIGGALGALFSAYVLLGLIIVVCVAGAVLWQVYVRGN